MIIREAVLSDIPELSRIRLCVKENVLSSPDLVQEKDYVAYLTERGKGWLAEKDGVALGFAIVDLIGHNVWALFVHPEFEKKGIGKQLHDQLLDWYFTQTQQSIWLSTAPNSRAEQLYHRAGWNESRRTKTGEIRFEMRYEDWIKRAQGFTGRK